MRSADALSRHGVTPEHLVKIARQALNDEMRRTGTRLDSFEYEDVLSFYVERGLAWACVYDVRKDPEAYRAANAFAASVYERMKPRLTDWQRKWRGDRRYGNDGRIALTATGTLEDGEDTTQPAPAPVESGVVALALEGHPVWRISQLTGKPEVCVNVELNQHAERIAA